MIYLGIDPGMTGAVAAVDDDGAWLFYFDVPIQERITLSGKERRCVDVMRLAKLLMHHFHLSNSIKINVYQGPHDVFATIEHPALYRPKDGAAERRAGQEKLLMSYAHLEAALWALNIETIECYPISWQSYFGLRKKGKAGSLELARRKWPAVDLSRKKDNNRAEALLLAEWGRMKKQCGTIAMGIVAAERLTAEPF